MKLKYIFASIVATLALAVSCQKEADHYLNEIKVSASYVSLSTGVGANNSITVTATDSWTITNKAEWLTISPTSGGAGETVVSFSAPAYEGGRTAEVTITSGDKTQFINVIQGVKTVSEVTCAEVMKNPGKTYRVTGTVTRIANTTYGNWNMDDGSYDFSTVSAADNKAGLYIYGTLDNKGNTKNFSYWGLEVGDKITVEGPSKDYNGTIEMVDVTVIKIVKSLIKVKEVVYPNPEQLTPAPDYMPVAGGEAAVTLTNKGESLKVVIPEDAKSWLSISNVDGDVVTLKALPNEGGDREATVIFGTNQGNAAYTCELLVSQKGAIVDATVAQFLAAEVGNTQYRLTGVITKVVKADYGNVNIKDFSGEVYVYGIGAKGDFEKLGLKEGDIVTLVGKRGEYNGPQMTGGQYESHIPVAKVTVAEFLAASESKEVWYMVSGKVTKPTEEGTKWDLNTYGNLNLTDATGSVYVYGVSTGVGGETKKFGTLGVKEGDEMTIIGYRTSYNGLNQVGGGMYVSHETPSASDEVFAKVTTAPQSWAGDYLIVWSGGAYATPNANSKDLDKTVDVTDKDGVISATDAVKAAAVKVAAVDGGYSIVLPGGKFLTFTTNGNQCTFADEAAPMNFEVTEGGIRLSGKDAGDNTRFLVENPNNGNPLHRAYKESSFIADGALKEGWAYPTLYKLTSKN